MMPLYQWRSDYLKNYAPGDIIVYATSVADARIKARIGYEIHVRERYDYLFFDGEPLDDDSNETLDCYRVKFETDIAAEPVTLPDYVFVAGSE